MIDSDRELLMVCQVKKVGEMSLQYLQTSHYQGVG